MSSFQEIYRGVLISWGWNRGVYSGVLISGGGGGGVGIEVYRGVLISGGWNRGALLCVLHFSETSCTNKEIIAN